MFDHKLITLRKETWLRLERWERNGKCLSEERGQELSAHTGLPEPFKVVFSVPTDMSKKVEKKIHEKLDKFRYRSDREFFKVEYNCRILRDQTCR